MASVWDGTPLQWREADNIPPAGQLLHTGMST